MARRKNSWNEYTFIGESPAVMEKEAITTPTVEIEKNIKEVEKKYRNNELEDQKLIMEFNKIYIYNFLSGKYNSGEVSLEAQDMLKLYCAYHYISGEPSKRNRRKNILLDLVKN